MFGVFCAGEYSTEAHRSGVNGHFRLILDFVALAMKWFENFRSIGYFRTQTSHTLINCEQLCYCLLRNLWTVRVAGTQRSTQTLLRDIHLVHWCQSSVSHTIASARKFICLHWINFKKSDLFISHREICLIFRTDIGCDMCAGSRYLIYAIS